MATTASERVKAFRKRQKAKGIKRVQPHDRYIVKAHAAEFETRINEFSKALADEINERSAKQETK